MRRISRVPHQEGQDSGRVHRPGREVHDALRDAAQGRRAVRPGPV